MPLTEKDVRYVAELAHLELTAEEVSKFLPQLDSILQYIDKLNVLDLSGIEPTPQVVTIVKHAVRDDRVAPRTGSSEAGRTVKLFKVPKVITER